MLNQRHADLGIPEEPRPQGLGINGGGAATPGFEIVWSRRHQGWPRSTRAMSATLPQPTVASALGAFDLDRLARVVGQRVVHAHPMTSLAPELTAPWSLLSNSSMCARGDRRAAIAAQRPT